MIEVIAFLVLGKFLALVIGFFQFLFLWTLCLDLKGIYPVDEFPQGGSCPDWPHQTACFSLSAFLSSCLCILEISCISLIIKS